MTTPRPSEAALSHRGPACPSCADWARGYAEGFARGRDAGRLEGALEGPAHPAVADSVARMFAGWDGPDAAHARSVAQFREWHASSGEVTVHAYAA